MATVTLFQLFSIFLLVAGCGATIDDTCVSCLCEFINESPTCDYMVGCRDGVCGPYALTVPFWVDGGSLSVGGGDSTARYRNCANNMNCAENTIRNYMNRYHKDCNGNGSEDCYDFASIHFNGPFACQKSLRDRQREALKNCLERSSNTIPDTGEPLYNTSDNPDDTNSFDFDVRMDGQ